MNAAKDTAQEAADVKETAQQSGQEHAERVKDEAKVQAQSAAADVRDQAPSAD